MAEATALGPVHPDCPTCACGKRAPVQPGGSVAWSEHEAAWAAYSRTIGTSQSPDDIAARGGFTIGELSELLGGTPATWRATPAERVTVDYVQVYEDGDGDFRWHRKAANNEIISESGEGYTEVGYAIKMATRLNPGVEVRVPESVKVPIPAHEPPVVPDLPPAPPAPPAAEPVRPFDGPVIPMGAEEREGDAAAPLEPPTDG